MPSNRNEYIKQYNKDKRVRISLNLSKEYESDIIQAIEIIGDGNKQAGVKKLCRLGMKNSFYLQRVKLAEENNNIDG